MISLFVLFIPLLSSEKITSWDDNVKIEQITNSYEIIEKNVEVETVIELFVSKNVKERNVFTIHFDPWEFTYVSPIEDVSFDICEGRKGSGIFYELQINCKKNISSYNINKIKDSQDYYDYNIVFDTSEINENKRYVIKIKYLLKNKIREKGDFSIFRTHFPNMEDMNVVSYIVLPNQFSVPEKVFPQNINFTMRSVGKGKGVIILDSPIDIWLWYIDTQKITRNRWFEDLFFVIVGFFLAIIYDMKKRKIQSNLKSLLNFICPD
ncbi:MAG: hypothetical protein ACE5ES_05310 [Candidatus Nanoarchaeia archaeon]